MSDLNRLADLLLPGIRSAQLKLEEVSNYLSVMPNSLRQYNGWQPIETAPKDGTRVLLYGNGAGVQWQVSEWVIEDKFAGWYPWDWPDYEEPTHWMQLPEPPK